MNRLIVFVVLQLTGLACLMAQESPVASPAGDDRAELRIYLPQGPIGLNQWLPLAVEIRNVGSTTISLRDVPHQVDHQTYKTDHGATAGPGYVLRIVVQAGGKKPYSSSGSARTPPVPPVSIPPGTYRFAKAHVLPAAADMGYGQSQIWAALLKDGREIGTSDPVTIEISPPPPATATSR